MNKGYQVIREFRDVYNKMAFLNKFKMEKCLKDFTPSEVHFIEYIEQNTDANVTKLAESFFMTRGAISKISKKLMGKGVIENYRRPDNNKEVYFRLTEHGRAVYKIHKDLHKEFEERDKAVFEEVTEEQFDMMLRFVEMYGRHLDAEIKKQGLDMLPDSDFN